MVRWSLALLIVLLPLAGAEEAAPMAGFVPSGPAPVTLFFHLDGIQDFPINTEAPPASYASEAPRGLATHTLTCPGAADSASGLTNDHHTYFGFVVASKVDYTQQEEGRMSVHRVEGTTGPMPLEQVPATLHWYLEAHAAARGDLPAVIPDVVVAASVRESPGVSVLHDDAFAAAPVVAHGKTEPAMLSPMLTGHPQVTHESVQGRHLYHFEVPLEPVAATVPEAGLMVRIQAYIDNPACQEGEGVMPNQAWPYTGPDHRPRLEWSVADQVRFTRFDPVVEDGAIRFDAEAVGGWGTQDLDPQSLRVEMRQGDVVKEAPIARLVTDLDEHDGGLRPATGAFVLDPPEGDGWIQVRAEAWNLQHTAKAEAYALVHPDGRVIAAEGPAAPASLPDGASVPAIGPAVIAAIALIGAALRRR